MPISNWFVRTERIKDKSKGLIEYSRYLVDKSHPNHTRKNTRIVKVLGSSACFAKNSIYECGKYDLGNKKGGRPIQSYAQSFVFSFTDALPPPTIKQWGLVTKDIIIALSKKMGIPASRLAQVSFINLHIQSNPHLNFVIPRVIDGVKYDMLDQISMIGTAKSAFNKAIKKHCNHDIKQYVPKNGTKRTRPENSSKHENQPLKKKILIDEIEFEIPEQIFHREPPKSPSLDGIKTATRIRRR